MTNISDYYTAEMVSMAYLPSTKALLELELDDISETISQIEQGVRDLANKVDGLQEAVAAVKKDADYHRESGELWDFDFYAGHKMACYAVERKATQSAGDIPLLLSKIGRLKARL